MTSDRWWAHLGGTDYISLEQKKWAIGFPGNHLVEVVPAGTTFNVSIPKSLTWLFDPHNPDYFLAALLHDYLLARGYDRATAAGAFNHGLKKSGVSKFKRMIMTTAVFLFKFN